MQPVLTSNLHGCGAAKGAGETSAEGGLNGMRAHQGCVTGLAVEQLKGEVGDLQLQLTLTLALPAPKAHEIMLTHVSQNSFHSVSMARESP